MKTIRNLLMAVAMSTIAISAIASDAARAEAKQIIEMKDGSTLYVFKDGKMAMEDKFGRTAHMKQKVVMEGKDGKKYIMIGNEVAWLNSLLITGHGN